MTESGKWRVKHDGVCDRCGTPLLRGQPAVWDRSSKTIRCIECPIATEEPAPLAEIERGTAGASAIREYERRMAKRDSVARDKWGNRLGGVVLALTDAPITTRAWKFGGAGEAKLAASLDGVEGIKVLHDRRVPGTRGNIDHIVIGPAGVFVIDAKAHKGLVCIRDRGGFLRKDLRLYVGSRDCTGLAEGMAWQIDAVLSALQRFNVELLPSVTPVLCFVEAEWPLLRAPESFGGVLLESPRSLRKLVTGKSELAPGAVDDLARAIASSLPAK